MSLDCVAKRFLSVNFRTSSTGLGLHVATRAARARVHKGRVGRLELGTPAALDGGVMSLWLP